MGLPDEQRRPSLDQRVDHPRLTEFDSPGPALVARASANVSICSYRWRPMNRRAANRVAAAIAPASASARLRSVSSRAAVDTGVTGSSRRWLPSAAAWCFLGKGVPPRFRILKHPTVRPGCRRSPAPIGRRLMCRDGVYFIDITVPDPNDPYAVLLCLLSAG
jgi:hypothetical protein